MTRVEISLDAVVVAVTEQEPRLLVVERDAVTAIPSGAFDPDDDPKLEAGLRRRVAVQTGLDVGYVEQLYTFGDKNRRQEIEGRRHLSVAYLALAHETPPSEGAGWIDWYEIFPWEDHRAGKSSVAREGLAPALAAWADGDPTRAGRVRITFGLEGAPWDPIRVLERFELLYEANLVGEAFRDRGEQQTPNLSTGRELAFDHRRVAATGLGRLRGKLTYRPVIFEVMPESFTLTQLQRTVEALFGMRIHMQNFRRLVERQELVEETGERETSSGGRPAKRYRFRREVVSERPRPGLRFPGLRG